MDDLNRLKVVLVEQKKTGKWLAEQLGVSTTTTSRWCSNASQPDLQTLKELKSHFSARRAMALVCKFEKSMMQLVQIMQKVTELTDGYRQKNLEK